jgi:hypothetical protein
VRDCVASSTAESRCATSPVSSASLVRDSAADAHSTGSMGSSCAVSSILQFDDGVQNRGLRVSFRRIEQFFGTLGHGVRVSFLANHHPQKGRDVQRIERCQIHDRASQVNGRKRDRKS